EVALQSSVRQGEPGGDSVHGPRPGCRTGLVLGARPKVTGTAKARWASPATTWRSGVRPCFNRVFNSVYSHKGSSGSLPADVHVEQCRARQDSESSPFWGSACGLCPFEWGGTPQVPTKRGVSPRSSRHVGAGDR